jgi:tuberous sclerosis protein 2
MTFHQELTETCVDLMARYAFADCSALPTRFPSTTFLLTGGHSQTWLIDNKIITITTSGCTQKELRDNLCDKCWLLCRKPSPALTNPVNGSEDDSLEEKHGLNAMDSSRRRHRSAFERSKNTVDQGDAVDGSEPKAKDDLHLEHKLQSMVGRKHIGGDESSSSGTLGDWIPKQKVTTITSRSKIEHFLES